MEMRKRLVICPLFLIRRLHQGLLLPMNRPTRDDRDDNPRPPQRRRTEHPSIVDRPVVPIYEETLAYINRTQPHIITFKPILTGGENVSDEEAQRTLAPSLLDAVTRQIRTFRPTWNNQRILATDGVLRGVNNSTDRGVGISRYINNLNEITFETLADIFDDMIQSDSDLDMYQIEWSFTIPPNIFVAGAGGEPVIPKWYKNPKQICGWQIYKDDQGTINCAAIALVLAMGRGKSKILQYHTKKGEFDLKKKARALQTEFGWDDHVSIDDLKKFVVKYPKYRVVCLMGNERDCSDYYHDGTEFEPAKNISGSELTPEKLIQSPQP